MGDQMIDEKEPHSEQIAKARTRLTKEQKAARSAAWKAKRAAATERRRSSEVRDRTAKAIREAASRRLVEINAAEDRELKRTGVDPALRRIEARKARLAAAAKREKQRISTLVLGLDPEPEPLPKKPAGMSKVEWKIEKARLRSEAKSAAALAEKWQGKKATPETLEYVERNHTDALVQLERNGTITKDQVEWAAEIANVYRSIQSDVAIGVASLEARVDNENSGRDRVAEGVTRVRMHSAYTIWRKQLPVPKQMVIDMLVDDAIGYTVAARRYRKRKETALMRLKDALDRWPDCVANAYRNISQDDVDELHKRLDAA